MTGPLGIWQHANGTEPDPTFGTCTDDVARALTVDLLQRRMLGWEAVSTTARRSMTYLTAAFDTALGTFRDFRGADGTWQGDVVAPIIRDLGAALAMRPEAATVRMVLSAQMAKAGPPMDGRDLHLGDFGWGILPAAAPLSISSLTTEERLEILLGMILTRAIDNRLKAFFNGSEVRHNGVPFQGKGFRSLGQEAIYAAAIRLKRGAAFYSGSPSEHGGTYASANLVTLEHGRPVAVERVRLPYGTVAGAK